MLQLLSGREHQVLSSVSVIYQQQQLSALSTTQVSFRAISPAELERYITSDEPYDKAGGYAIQGRASAFISHLVGSYSNIVGLPLYEVSEVLRGAGYPFQSGKE